MRKHDKPRSPLALSATTVRSLVETEHARVAGASQHSAMCPSRLVQLCWVVGSGSCW
jgi:hypothetical protein